MRAYLTLVLTIFLVSFSLQLKSQYCTPPSFLGGPYLGITNVTLGWLNNSSAYDGGVTYYSAVLGPTLEVDSQYTVSVKTIDNRGLGMNSRVWIDWNQDMDFNDSLEEVGVWDSHGAGISTKTFNVPSNAVEGKTRMRVYTDMDSAGQIAPNPCGYLNSPGHTVGLRGEVEDYDVDITVVSGINRASRQNGDFQVRVFPDGTIMLDYRLIRSSYVIIELFTILGQKVNTLVKAQQLSGKYEFAINRSELGNALSKVYFVRMLVDGKVYTKKFLLPR